MAKKSKKRFRKSLISKDWKAKDGIVALPEVVQNKVSEVLTRLKIGAEQQANFFDRKFGISQRQTIAYELSMAGVSYRDIATLLGVTVMGAHTILERARAEVIAGLPQNWLAANFVDDYYALKTDAQWNRAKSESADSDEMAAVFRRNAITATAKSGEFLLKAEAINKLLGSNSGDKLNPTDRLSFMQHVFETKILPLRAIEPPKKLIDAEIEKD